MTDKTDTIDIPIDRSLLEVALRCGVDLSYDGSIAIKRFILSRMIGVSFDTADDAAHVAFALLGDMWSQWVTIVERDYYGQHWYELVLNGAAWLHLTERYLTPQSCERYVSTLKELQ